MAKGRYKITIGLRLLGQGASESYISANAEDSAQSGALENLLYARARLLHQSITFDGVRVAQIADDLDKPLRRKSKFHRPGQRYVYALPDANGANGVLVTVPSRGTQTTDTWLPDHFQSLAEIRWSYGGGRQTTRYMTGWPDAAMNSQPPTAYLGKVIDLPEAWANWVKVIRTEGWCIQARSQVAPFNTVPILKWTQPGGIGTLLAVEVAAGDMPAWVTKGQVHISGTRRRGTDRMSYNGIYGVDSVVAGTAGAPTTVFLATSEAGEPISIKKPGTIQRVDKGFVGIDFLEVIQAGTHKRGNGLNKQRGRRSKRVLLDP